MKKKMVANAIASFILSVFLLASSISVVGTVSITSRDISLMAHLDTFMEDFENGVIPYGWLNVDHDGDGFNWEVLQSPKFPAHSGNYSAGSASYVNEVGPLTPDNWLILPGLVISSSSEISYWVAAQDQNWSEEHLEVWISTSGTTIPDFTDEVDSFTLPMGSADWSLRTVDISMYEGETIRIAFRHTDVTDQFWIKIDDIIVTDVTPAEDVLPPITSCELQGDLQNDVYIGEVLVILSAIDDSSGVNFTMYKIDNGSYERYTSPFIVSDLGLHVITFYSEDNSGNIEDPKECVFSNICPLTIELGGGFGVTATITNIGSKNFTNVNWSIIVDGTLVILGAETTGTIENIPAGESVGVKSDFVLGIGKITIRVLAECTEATSDGFLLLFFLLSL